MTALPAWRQRLAAVAVLMPHSFSVRLEPDDARWIRARSAVMAVHESNFHAPCCEACGKEWGKTVPTAESDPFVMVLSKLHVHGATRDARIERVRVSLLLTPHSRPIYDVEIRYDSYVQIYDTIPTLR